MGTKSKIIFPHDLGKASLERPSINDKIFCVEGVERIFVRALYFYVIEHEIMKNWGTKVQNGFLPQMGHFRTKCPIFGIFAPIGVFST